MIKFLIDNRCNLESKDHFGNTPLIRSADSGFLEIVEYLIEKGANVNSADTTGYTPLICACINGHFGVVKLLLEKGADINQPDNDGFTPLMHASQNDRVKIVRYLLKKGADKTVKSKRDYMALDLCHKDKIKELLNKEQEFVIKFVPPTEEEIAAAKAAKRENETEDHEYGVIYGLLTNWNPFA